MTRTLCGGAELSTLSTASAAVKVRDSYGEYKDPSSFAFRYATDKKGREIRLPILSIDLHNIRDVMQAVTNFFQGVDGQLDYKRTI